MGSGHGEPITESPGALRSLPSCNMRELQRNPSQKGDRVWFWTADTVRQLSRTKHRTVQPRGVTTPRTGCPSTDLEGSCVCRAHVQEQRPGGVQDAGWVVTDPGDCLVSPCAGDVV